VNFLPNDGFGYPDDGEAIEFPNAKFLPAFKNINPAISQASLKCLEIDGLENIAGG
jgi:hypothetical protein